MKLVTILLLILCATALSQVPAVNSGSATYPTSGAICGSTNATCFQVANNLSEGTAGTMRTNLGLGTASTVSSTCGGSLSGTLPNCVIAAGSTPVWVKVTVANSSTNFTVTCAGPASFTALCGTSPVAKAAATTQSVVLATPGAAFVIDNCIAKTVTQFAGPTTLIGTVGITGSLTGCVSVNYNLEAAVSNTNFGLPTVVPSAVSFNGTDSVILALTSTVQNISTISAGSVTVWLKLVLLP